MALFGVVFALGAGQAAAQNPSAPTNVEATQTDATEVKLTWNAPASSSVPIAGYQWRLASEDWNIADDTNDVPANMREHTIAAGVGLAATLGTGTPYRFEVRSFGPGDVVPTEPDPRKYSAVVGDSVTLVAAPGPPTGLEAEPGDKHVTLSWNAPAAGAGPVESYEYRHFRTAVVDTVTDTSPAWMSAGTSMMATITGLTNGTVYTFQVRSKNLAGVVPATGDPITATPAAVPSAPRNLRADRDVTAGKLTVTLQWDWDTTDNGGSTVTRFEYRRVGEAWGSLLATDRSVELSDLDPDMQYTFNVRAVNAVGEGAVASVSTGDSAVEAPGAPTSLRATAGNGQVRLSWAAPSSGGAPTGYQYRVTVARVSGEWMPDPAQTGTTATVTDLTNGTEYTFEVRAVNAAGEGPVASEMATPVAPTVAPGIPENLGATPGDGQVTLSWEAPTTGGTPTGYEFRSEVSDRWSDWADTSSMTGHTVTALTNGAEYTFEVRAMNAAGDGPAASATATPMAAPTPTRRGQITEFKLVGSDVREKTIAGVERHHVLEGSREVALEATVTWTYAEIEEINYNTPQRISVEIGSDRGERPLPNWVSWVDNAPGGWVGGEDVHFAERSGNFRSVLTVRTPPRSAIPENEWGNPRLTHSAVGLLPVLILHDGDEEAENDAFYIEAYGGDVNLGHQEGSSYTYRTLDVVIEDIDPQTVKIGRGSGAEVERTIGGHTYVYEPAGDPEINPPVFTVFADPPRKDLPLEVRLDMVDLEGVTVSSGEISLSKSSMTLNSDRSGTRESNRDYVTVHLPDSDGNRKDDDYELHTSVNVYSVSSGGYELNPAGSHQITVVDRHKLPHLTVSPKTGMLTEGGEPLELTLTLDRNPRTTRAVTPEKRQYTYEPIDVMVDMLPDGIEIMPRPVKFPEYKERDARAPWTQEMKVEVTATPNDNLDGERMVNITFEAAGTNALDGMGSGDGDEHTDMATLTVEDGTDSLVWAKSPEEVEAAVMAAKKAGMGDDMMFTAGEMIELEGNDLFGSAQGVSVSYSAMVEGDAVSESVSGGVVTITADSMGMAKVTITARTSRPSGAVVINDQPDPREASITIALEVGLVALSIELSGPEDMNLVEGMDHANGTKASAMVTATANRAVTEDVTVTLMRDRAMSSADEMDYTAEPIMIMAGQMTGSTMVMAVADDMMENEGNMAEELVLYGMAADNAGEVTGHVKFYVWDAAVPALPVIAQLLLAALMAVGGYRRYRRR